MARKKPQDLQDTRVAILEFLLGQDLSAVHLKHKLGINESAVRRHLDILERKGFITYYFERAPSGRPKKLYSITQAGRVTFPQKIHFLFAILARRMGERYGAKALQTLMSDVAEDFAEHLAKDISATSKDERLKELVRSFDKFGFYASLSKKDGAYQIKYKNCVFGNVIKEFGDHVCFMHRQVIRRVLGDVKVEMERSLAKGDNFCVQRILIS